LSDEKSFPEKIFNGEPISKIKGSLSVFKCVMSEFQNKWYVNSINNTEGDNTLFKSSSDAATIVYPDGSYGSKGYNTNISKLGNKSIPFLQKDALKIYSTKLYHLIKNLEKSPGPVFIYSNFVNQGGTDLIKKTLEQNGYSGYLVRNNKPKFLLITTALTANQRQKYLNIFNDPSNAYGKTIKIIIGSPLVSEGLTFRAIRQIHILEPYWNLSRMDQIIGRGVRFGSHADLPARERKVNIYLYTAISTTSPSIDLMKYRLGENKDVIIKHIEYEIKKQAIDCKLNKSQNSKSLSQVPDYSRECNYLKCHYSCNGNGNSGSSGSRSSGLIIDDNTYVLENHSPSEYFYILEKIKKLFNETSGVKIFDVDYIVNYIKQDEGRAIDPRNIYIVLNDTLNRSGIIKDNHTLIALGNYYILNDNTIPINQAYFFKLFKKTMKSKVLEEIFDIKEEKKRRTPIIEKEKSKEKTIRSKIYGSFMNKEGRNDNKFRIIDNRSISEAASDKRKIASGKVCTSYQKEDLENIMKFFNIKMPAKISKSTLCLAIEDFMKRNNLVVR